MTTAEYFFDLREIVKFWHKLVVVTRNEDSLSIKFLRYYSANGVFVVGLQNSKKSPIERDYK